MKKFDKIIINDKNQLLLMKSYLDFLEKLFTHINSQLK